MTLNDICDNFQTAYPASTSETLGLKHGGTAPSFVLPSTEGGESGPGALRSKYNMVLAFVDDTPEGLLYLQALSDIYPEILVQQERLVTVVPLPLEAARQLIAKVSLGHPLLADAGKTTHRMLGMSEAGAVANVVRVADRFGKIFDVKLSGEAGALPAPRSLLDWLEYIQLECLE